MSISVVQTTPIVSVGNKPANDTSWQAAFTNPVGGGNGLILLLAYQDDSGHTWECGGVSDNQGNAWNFNGGAGDKQGANNHTSATIFSAPNALAASTTITVKNAASSTSGYYKGIGIEISGIPLSSILDGPGGAAANGNQTSVSSGAGGSPASSAEIAFAVFALNNNSSSWSSGTGVPSGWTDLGHTLGSYPSYGFAYLLPTGGSPLTANFGTLNTAGNVGIAMALYKASVSGGVIPVYRRRRIYSKSTYHI